MNWIVIEESMDRLGLTEIERETVRLYLAGYSRARIADGLYRHEQSVANRITRIMRKVGADRGATSRCRIALLRALSGVSVGGAA